MSIGSVIVKPTPTAGPLMAAITGNVYTAAARGHVDDKRFDQMAAELKA